MKFTLDQKSFKKAAGNMESLFDKVSRLASQRAMKKAVRLGIIEARRIAKGIPELGNTKSLRVAVKHYKASSVTVAYVGWDAKIPVRWLGLAYKSSGHGHRIEFGGTVKRRGKRIRTRPYSVLRKSFELRKAAMEKIYVEELQKFMRIEAAKLNT